MVKNEFKKFIRNIFSLRNDGTDKLITILGIPIRIDRSKYYKEFCAKLPVDENRIVIDNFNGGSYGCNPKYITEELLKRNKNYDIVWLVHNPKKEIKLKHFPVGIRLVAYGSKQALKELASARIWIDNQRKNYYIKKGVNKKKEQYYLNTWHGALGIKKIGQVADNYDENDNWVILAKKDAAMLDYIFSNSQFENEVFKLNFWSHGKIIQTGHPRNDLFFKSAEEIQEIKKKVFKDLGITPNKKILIYVPSYREDKRLNCYGLDIDKLSETLNQKFCSDWIIIIRMHPHLKKESYELFNFNKNIINASYYPDIQELLVSADCAITDYSSCIFDFMLSRKPAFIFATDIEQFNNERGFYYPLESTPFPIATDNDELASNIINFDYEKYKQDVEQFLKDKGCMEDGHASERVVDLIEKIINEN